MVTARTSYNLIKEELLFSWRNADLISITNRGVTTTSTTFSGDGVTLVFDINSAYVKNIRSIIVSSVSKSFVTDYTVDTNYTGGKCRITFLVAPASGTNNIVVSYDAGTTDRIFPDYPKSTITSKDDYPRIGFEITNERTQEVALGGGATMTEIEVTVIAYAMTRSGVDDLLQSIRSYILGHKKNYKRFKFITPSTIGPMLPRDGMKDQLFYRNTTYTVLCDLEE